MKAMLKCELADCAGVSRRTLARWLSLHRTELEQLGLTPSMRLLPPRVVAYICRQYGIELPARQQG